MRVIRWIKPDWVTLFGVAVALLLFLAYFKAIGGIVHGYSGLD